jgi:hypothetical protein
VKHFSVFTTYKFGCNVHFIYSQINISNLAYAKQPPIFSPKVTLPTTVSVTLLSVVQAKGVGQLLSIALIPHI